jgi:hypothetical protein
MDFEIEKQDKNWSDGFREACRAEAERPAHFWAAQRANIRAGIATNHHRWSLRVALASTAALFVVAAAMLAGSHAPAAIPQSVTTATNISDQELLADIDETLRNPIPDALAPADLLAQDLDRSLKASGKKETR